MAIILYKRGRKDSGDGRGRISNDEIINKLIVHNHNYNDCINVYSYGRMLTFFYMCCKLDNDMEIRSLRSIMVGDKKDANKLQNAITKLDNSKKEMQREIEVISGISPKQTTEIGSNNLSVIAGFGQATREKNIGSSKQRKSTRPKRVK